MGSDRRAVAKLLNWTGTAYNGPLNYLSGGMLKYNDILTLTCVHGYRVDTTDPAGSPAYNRTCQSDCVLANDSPRCTAVTCGVVTLPPFAFIASGSSGELFHSESVVVQCELGYKVNGTECDSSFQVACDDGELGGAERTCVPVQCGCGSAPCLPDVVASLNDTAALPSIRPASLAHGTVVQVYCQTGYRATATSFAACSDPQDYLAECDDCTWRSVERRVCRQVHCPLFEESEAYDAAVENVTFSAHGATMEERTWEVNGTRYRNATQLGWQFGTLAVVRCKRGFRATEWNAVEPDYPLGAAPREFISQCRENCAFSTLDRCFPVSCGPFAPPPNSFRAPVEGAAPQQLLHGDSVEVECLPGYKVAGTGGSACESRFMVQCEDGVYARGGKECVPIDCDAGDRCGVASSGVCLAFQDAPGFGAIAEGVEDWEPKVPSAGGVVTILCRPGYRAVPAGGEVELSTAACTAPASFRAHCDECQWSVNATCRPVTCGHVSRDGVANYSIEGPNAARGQVLWAAGQSTMVYDMVVTVQCAEGFRGSTAGNGLASLEDPEVFSVSCVPGCELSSGIGCKPLSCGAFPAVAFAFEDADWGPGRLYRTGEELQVTCHSGYRVEGECGDSFVVACEGGVFVGEKRCVARSCEDECGGGSCGLFTQQIGGLYQSVRLLGNFSNLPDQSDVPGFDGDQAEVTCIEGYAATSYARFPSEKSDCPLWPRNKYVATCTNCSWTRQYYCAQVQCNKTTIAGEGVRVPDFERLPATFDFQSEVSVECEYGFAFFGVHPVTSVQCTETCAFAAPPPCEKIRCPPITPPANARTVGLNDSRTYFQGDDITVLCLAGYRVVGTECTPRYTSSCDLGSFVPAAVGCELAPWDYNRSLCSVCPRFQGELIGDSFVASYSPDTQRISGETLDVTCKEGYRAAPFPFQDPVGCDDPPGYQITCVGSAWRSAWRCMPVTCHAFSSSDPRVASVAPPTPILFGQSVSVSCQVGYRPGSDDASADVSFDLPCLSNCSYRTRLPRCTAVTCPVLATPRFTSAVDPWLSQEGRVPAPVPTDNRFRMVHGDEASFACNRYYTLPERNCSDMYTVSCVDGELRGAERCEAAVVGTGCGPCNPSAASIEPGAAEIVERDSDMEVLHADAVHVRCRRGFRVAPRPRFNSSCAAVANYSAVCQDGSYLSRYYCAPVLCPAFFEPADPFVNFSAPGTDVLFQAAISVVCNVGFRPGSEDPAMARSYGANCTEFCEYGPSHFGDDLACTRVRCEVPAVPTVPDLVPIAGVQATRAHFNFPSAAENLDPWTPYVGAQDIADYVAEVGFFHEGEIQVECDFGYQVVGETPCLRTQVTSCVDGTFAPTVSCEPAPFGCATSPCPVFDVNDTFTLGDGVDPDTWERANSPRYGRNGFWADGTRYRGLAEGRFLNHRSRVTAQCVEGYRAIPSTGRSNSTCDNPNTEMTAECGGGDWLYSSVCVRELCPRTEFPHVARQSPDRDVLLDDAVDYTCVNYSRAMPSGEIRPAVDACAFPRSFVATCIPGCDLRTQVQCHPVWCPPFADVALDPHLNATGAASAALPFNATAELRCSIGYRAGSSLANATRKFSVSCLDSCQYAGGVECVLVSCGRLEAPNHTTFLAPLGDVASHNQELTLQCDSGYRVLGAERCVDNVLTNTFRVSCFDGFYQAVGACIPIVCPAFNENDDEGAESWSVTGDVPWLQTINVTCKPGYRAVPVGVPELDVRCNDTRWYISQCGSCRWEAPMQCKRVPCPLLPSDSLPAINWFGPNSLGWTQNIDVFVESYDVFHEQRINVVCSLGHRATVDVERASNSAPGAAYIAMRGYNESCDADLDFKATCDDCRFRQDSLCVPIQCPAETPERSVGASPAGAVLFNESVTYTCADTARAMSQELRDTLVDACSADARFSARCGETEENSIRECSMRSDFECSLVWCPAYEPLVGDPSELVNRSTPASWFGPFAQGWLPGAYPSEAVAPRGDLYKVFHGESISIGCQQGFRATPVRNGSLFGTESAPTRDQIAALGLNESCAAPIAFAASCDRCTFMQAAVCVPIECPRASFDFVAAQSPPGAVLYGAAVNYTCTEHARAMTPSTQFSEQDVCALSSTFTGLCTDDCSMGTSSVACSPVWCNAYQSIASGPQPSGSGMTWLGPFVESWSYEEAPRQGEFEPIFERAKVFHNYSVSSSCITGYRVRHFDMLQLADDLDSEVVARYRNATANATNTTNTTKDWQPSTLAEEIAALRLNATCEAEDAFEATCLGCAFHVAGFCVPVECPRQPMDGVVAQMPDTALLFGEPATFTCNASTRAMTAQMRDEVVDACAVGSTFTHVCSDECTFANSEGEDFSCSSVWCPAYSTIATQPQDPLSTETYLGAFVADWRAVNGSLLELRASSGMYKLFHNSRFAVHCAPGYRAMPLALLGSSPSASAVPSALVPNASEVTRRALSTTCSAPEAFRAACDLCSLQQDSVCVPVECPPENRSLTASQAPGRTVLFGERTNFTCVPHARAMPPATRRSSAVDACAFPSSYQADCGADCGLRNAEHARCRLIWCPAFLDYTSDRRVIEPDSFLVPNTSGFGGFQFLESLATPVADNLSYPVLYGTTMVAACQSGFRAGSKDKNASRFFSVTCLANCSYSEAPVCIQVSCGEFDPPPNTFVAGVGEAEDGDFVTVRCNEGFYIQGEPQCLPPEEHSFEISCFDGDYEKPQDVCVIASCKDFNANPLEPDDAFAESWIFVPEDLGHSAVDTNSSNLTSANWTNTSTPFNATSNSSLFVNVTANGTLANPFLFGAVLNVSCKPGYRAAAVGSRYSACSDPAWYLASCGLCGWERSRQCAPISCPLPTTNDLFGPHVAEWSVNPEFLASVAASRVAINNTLTVTCDAGYRAKDVAALAVDSSLSATLERYWSGNGSLNASCAQTSSFTAVCVDCSLYFTSSCVPIRCEAPTGENSEEGITGDILFEESVEFSCTPWSRALTFEGIPAEPFDACAEPHAYSAVCQNDCAVGTNRTCQPVWCPAFVGLNTDANLNLSSSEVDTSRSIAAVSLPGSEAAPALSPVGYNGSFHIECNIGYRAGSEDNRRAPRGFSVTCQDNCSYTEQTPCVVVSCGYLDHPEHSSFLGPYFHTARHLQKLTAECHQGFYVEGRPRCVDGVVSDKKFDIPCFDGEYGEIGACVPMECRDEEYTDPFGSWAANTRYDFGELLLVTCLPGYRAVPRASASNFSSCADPRSYSVTCGTCDWESEMECRPVRCTGYNLQGVHAIEPPLPLLVGEQLSITCSEGYMPAAASATTVFPVDGTCAFQSFNATCNHDCGLDAQSVCRRASCPPFNATEEVATATVGGPTAIGSEIRVSCPENMRFDTYNGSSTTLALCQDDCQYSREAEQDDFQCYAAGCPLVNPFPFSQVQWPGIGNASLLEPGATVTVSCIEGYRATSLHRSNATCRDNATFTAACSENELQATMQCTPIACPSLTSADPHIESVVPATGTLYRDTVDITCESGFRPGSSMASDLRTFRTTCAASCEYDPPFEGCEEVSCPLPTLLPRTNAHLLLPPDFNASVGLFHNASITVECDFGFRIFVRDGDPCLRTRTLRCADGVFGPAVPECVRAECGCPTSACPVTLGSGESIFGPFVEGWSARPFPEYGQDGFWAREATFLNFGDTRVNHGINVSVACLPGYHAIPLEQLPLPAEVRAGDLQDVVAYSETLENLNRFRVTCSPEEAELAAECSQFSANTSCAFRGTAGFSTACDDCLFDLQHLCVPTECPRAEFNNTRSQTPDEEWVLFSETVEYACVEHARAMPSGTIDNAVDACAFSSSFTATCSLGCSLATDVGCFTVWCPAYVDANAALPRRQREAQLNTSVPSVLAPTPHNGTITVTCNAGYRAGSSVANSSRSFDVTCQSDCGYTDAPACTLVSCGPLAVPDNGEIVGSTSVASHGDQLEVQCNAGHRVGGVQQCDRRGRLSDSFAVDCVDGRYRNVGECLPITCPAFNADASDPEDPLAQEWNTSSANSTLHWSGTINVTCAENHRAVALTEALASCSDPTWYIARCGDCGWETSHHCKPIACRTFEIVEGVDSRTPTAPLLLGETITVSCSEGYMPEVPGTNSSEVYPRSDGALCKDTSYVAECRADCAFHSELSCVAASCPPWTDPDGIAEAASAESLPLGDAVEVRCPAGYRFDSRFGEQYSAAVCNSDCSYARQNRSAPDFRCYVASCGTFTLPSDSSLAWRSDPRVNSEFWVDDSLVVTCDAGTMVAASAPPACKFQFQVVCEEDGAFALVDDSVLLNASNSTFHVGELSDSASINVVAVSEAPLPYHISTRSLASSAAMCKPLTCGCGQCSSDPSFSAAFGYDVPSVVPFLTQLDTIFYEESGYTLPNYLFFGRQVTLPCKHGYRSGTHAPAGPRTTSVTCEADTWTEAPTTTAAPTTTTAVAAGPNATTTSALLETSTFIETTAAFARPSTTPAPKDADGPFNCGIGEPTRCLPVSCGAFQPPPNGSVSTDGWSPGREYLFEDAALPLEVQCGEGFMASDSSALECRKTWSVTCDAEGHFTPQLTCTPIRCDLRSIRAVDPADPTAAATTVNARTTLAVLPPAYWAHFPPGLFNTSGSLADALNVSLGESVSVLCAPDFARSTLGSTELTCGAGCQFAPAAIACTLFDGSCEALDGFELGPGVADNDYFDTLGPLSAFEEVPVGCRAGYRLDNSDGSVVIAGLELLGPIRVQGFRIFPEPDPAVTSELSLEGLLDGAAITMPPGAWSVGGGPVYVGVFDLKALLRRAGRRATAAGGEILSQALNLGPDVDLGASTQLAVPFDKDRGEIFNNPSFEIAVWRYDPVNDLWTQIPYPDGMTQVEHTPPPRSLSSAPHCPPSSVPSASSDPAAHAPHRRSAPAVTEGSPQAEAVNFDTAIALGATDSFSVYAVRAVPAVIATPPPPTPPPPPTTASSPPQTTLPFIDPEERPPPNKTTPPPNPPEEKKGFCEDVLCVALFAGIGGLLLLCCCVGLFLFLRRRGRQSQEKLLDEEEEEEEEEEEMEAFTHDPEPEYSWEEAEAQLAANEAIEKADRERKDDLRRDWLQAVVAVYRAEQELEDAKAGREDAQFVIKAKKAQGDWNPTMEPKYNPKELDAKSVKELKGLVEEEDLDCKGEPFFFQRAKRKQFLSGKLKEVQVETRDEFSQFLVTKEHKVEIVTEELEYKKELRDRLLQALDDEKTHEDEEKTRIAARKRALEKRRRQRAADQERAHAEEERARAEERERRKNEELQRLKDEMQQREERAGQRHFAMAASKAVTKMEVQDSAVPPALSERVASAGDVTADGMLGYPGSRGPSVAAATPADVVVEEDDEQLEVAEVAEDASNAPKPAGEVEEAGARELPRRDSLMSQVSILSNSVVSSWNSVAGGLVMPLVQRINELQHSGAKAIANGADGRDDGHSRESEHIGFRVPSRPAAVGRRRPLQWQDFQEEDRPAVAPPATIREERQLDLSSLQHDPGANAHGDEQWRLFS